MADNSSSKSSSFSPLVVLTLVAAFGGMYFLHPPLISSRPPSQASGYEAEGLPPEDVESRLWQDPFETVNKHANAEVETAGCTDTNHELDTLDCTIQADLSGDRRLLVLAVMETSQPYADDHESRLKSRYATVSALLAADYEPEDSAHIGYVDLDPCRTNVTTSPCSVNVTVSPCCTNVTISPCNTNTVTSASPCSTDAMIRMQPFNPRFLPFEFFKRSSLATSAGNYSRVLVLWVEDEVFNPSPIESLGGLMKGLAPAGKAGDVWTSNNLSLKVIGPRSSTTLRNMVQDTNSLTNWLHCTPANPVMFYSTWATAADGLLVTNLASIGKTVDIGSKLASINPIIFTNVTIQDNRLCQTLIHELENRGVSVYSTQDCIALISESDTFYGRALPLTFNKEVSQQWDQDSSNIWRYRYLKGLDGMLANSKQKPSPKDSDPVEKKQGDDDNGKGQAADLNELLRPEGESQLDDLSRLAARLKDRDRQWKQGREHGSDGFFGERRGLRAIGVLGSDVYDKLLILQALRPEFPGAIFFTTDLDARLLDSTQWKAAHNLIVASDFDLELGRTAQRGIPPFRDCYQTSIFLASLIALDAEQTNVLGKIEPRLYEVGRNGAIDLTRDRQKYKSLYPQWNPLHFTTAGVAWATGTGIFCLILVFPFIEEVKKLVASLLRLFIYKDSQSHTAKWVAQKLAGSRPWFRLLGFCMTVGVIICLSFAIKHSHNDGDGEPWSLIDGVSLWPAECLRAFGLLTAFFLLVKGYGDCQRSDGELVKHFQLDSFPLKDDQKGGAAAAEPQKQHPGKTWLNLWEGIVLLHPLREAITPQTVDVKRLFSAYRELGLASRRFRRVLPILLIYVALFLGLFRILGFPHVPYRGLFSKRADGVMLFLSVLGLTSLLFFVVDATRLCKKFVNVLQEQPSTWPPDLYKSYGCEKLPDQNPLVEWLDIQMIASLTETVGQLVIYPFIVIFIIMVARNAYFDDWDWPLPLILVFVANGAYALSSGIMLRRAAETARQRALDSLTKKLFVAQGSPDESANAKTIRMTIKQIRTIQKGTFAPWSSHPLVGAILIPFGGSGLLALIQYLIGR